MRFASRVFKAHVLSERGSVSLFMNRPILWVPVLLFLASNLFVASFARVAHWVIGVPSVNVSALCRWDCGWYSSILAFGYDASPHFPPADGAANWSFFPLFPSTALPLTRLLGLPVQLALVLASKAALLLAIWSFLLLVRDQLSGIGDFFLAGALVAFNPYILHAHAGYAEPLYFTLCSLAFWALARGQWIESGILGGFLSAVRIVGVLFCVSYLIACLKRVGIKLAIRDRTMAIPLGMLLCPLGITLYALYLYYHTGDALGFLHIRIHWHQSVDNPLTILWSALAERGWSRVWGLMALAGFAASAWLVKLGRAELGAYLAGAILMSLAGGISALPRNLWWQAPFLYAIFNLLKRYQSLSVLYFPFAGGLASVITFWWFTQKDFVM